MLSFAARGSDWTRPWSSAASGVSDYKGEKAKVLRCAERREKKMTSKAIVTYQVRFWFRYSHGWLNDGDPFGKNVSLGNFIVVQTSQSELTQN